MAIRILHFADCHLGYVPAWLGARGGQELVERRAQDFARTFERIIDIACDESNAIDLVAIAGDFFERHDPDDRTVAHARNQFQRLADRHVPVVLVPGNHDSISYPASVFHREAFPGVTLVTSPEFAKVMQLAVRGETVHVYSLAQDLTRGVETIESFARTGEPGIHVAVIHGAVWSNPSWDLKEADFPIRPEAIARSGMHYVALGHSHKFTQYDEGGVLAVYPGSTEGRDFGECGPRSVVIAEVSEAGAKVERRDCHTRELREVMLDLGECPAATDEEIAARVRGQGGDTILLRLRLTGPADFVPDAAAVRDRLAGSFFYVEVLDETRLVDGALVGRLRNEPTIRGLFARRMLERIESAEGTERATAELALKLGLNEFLRHTTV
jgi:exonuclease SbcD